MEDGATKTAEMRMNWRQHLNKRAVLAAIYIALRYYAAFTLFTYGFAKLMGAQFTVLDSQLMRPMGEVSGFWLTWYYFGYSPVYSAIIAFTQIGGAVLLCFRRTALLGAFVLLPVMVNIVCVDVWVIRFGASSGALHNAIYVLAALVAICAFHVGDMYRFFLCRREGFALFVKGRWWIAAIQIVIMAGMLAYTAHNGYWEANVNNRRPTPIDGAWHVTNVGPAMPGVPDWIYFEYNRAHKTVFQYPDGKQEPHDFRVDPQTHSLMISQQWFYPGTDVVFDGTWKRQGDTLTITGKWRGNEPLTATLQRKKMPVKDHK